MNNKILLVLSLVLAGCTTSSAPSMEDYEYKLSQASDCIEKYEDALSDQQAFMRVLTDVLEDPDGYDIWDGRGYSMESLWNFIDTNYVYDQPTCSSWDF